MNPRDAARRMGHGPVVLGRRLRAMAVVRAAMTAAVTAFLLTAGSDLVTTDQAPLIVATVVVLLGFSLTVPAWPTSVQRAVLDVSLVVDAGGVAVLLAVTGGVSSPFGSLVVLVVALTLLAFGVRTGLRMAVVTSLAVGWVWAERGSGPAAPPATGAVDDTRVLVLLLATWVAVAGVALLARVVERDLREVARDSARIREVGRATRPEEGVAAVAQQLAEGLVAHLEVASASVWLPHDDGLRLVPVGHHSRRGTIITIDRAVRTSAPLVRQARQSTDVVVGTPPDDLAALHDGTVALVRASGRPGTEDALLVVAVPRPRRRARHEHLVHMLGELARDAADALDEARHLAQLRELARTDAVTGLLNHRAMHERLDAELARVERQRQRGQPAGVALALFDLDHFKRVNDQYGHPTGDAVLAAVAEAVDRAARAGDVVCRYGGEEFAVILADTAGDDARRACERFRHILADVRVPAPDGTPVGVTASWGVASTDGPEVARDQLVAQADAALYRAKAQGRDRVVSAGAVTASPASRHV